MKKTLLSGVVAASALSLLCVASQVFADSHWQRINAPTKAKVTVNGQDREIFPGCGFVGDDYSFYFKQGKSDKLVVFFNGGGACWNSATCLASLQTPQPTWVPTDDIGHNVPSGHGLFDANNSQNPYAEWSMVYLPYCTGDVHFGSKEQSYVSPTGVTQVIRHRGFDNFLYVRQWLRQLYTNRGDAPSKMLVTGSSAGAYGAVLNYAHLKNAFPNAKGYLLADAGNGVLTEAARVDAVAGAGSAWNFDANLATFVPGMGGVTTLSATSVLPGAYAALSGHYTKDRFSQYTAVHDFVQILFYNIMLNSNDMSAWQNITGSTVANWTGAMLQNSYQQASLSNYRFYIAPGCMHTVLRSDRMYSNSAVNGVTFVNWFNSLVNGNASSWSNQSCTDSGCQYQPLTTEDIVACSSI